MRLYFDSEEDRALLAARLGYGSSVSDGDLAGALAAWFDDKPLPANNRVRPDDLEDLQIVSDWSEVDEAEPGGYANNQTGWIGAG